MLLPVGCLPVSPCPSGGGTSVYLFLTLLALLFVSSNAFAQSLDVSVVWTRDATVTPNTVQCSRSGDLGGTAVVHVRFQQPPNAMNCKVQELRVHENDAHTGDTWVHDQSFNASPRPECGDPPPGTPNMLYFDQTWLITGGHNGTHTITATVYYTTPHFPLGQDEHTVPLNPPLAVNARNLTVAAADPANPDPILWNGPGSPSKTIAATLDAAYRADVPVTLRIYTSEQSLVKTLQQTFRVDGSTDASFVWDGSQDMPLTGIAPQGVYLFKFDAGPPGHAPADLDCEKSTALQITPAVVNGQQVPIVRYGGRQQNGNILFLVSYHLNVKGLLPDAHIDVYGPDLVNKGTFPLYAPDVEAGNHADGGGGNMSVRVEMPEGDLSLWGMYTFVICIRDDAANQDRGHRNRWALQLGGLYGYQPVNTTDPAGDGGADPLFRGLSEGQNQTSCPIVIKGMVGGDQNEKPLLTYVFTDVLVDVPGGPVIIVTPIPANELEAGSEHIDWDAQAGKWKFRVTWNQQLLRTSVMDPIEFYYVGASALCAPNQSAHDRTFRVVSMAKPSNDPVPPNGDYTEGERFGQGQWLPTFARANDGTGIEADLWSTGGPHLAVDYMAATGSSAGHTINAAEYGLVNDSGAFVKSEDKAMPPDVTEDIWTTMKAWKIANNYAGDVRDALMCMVTPTSAVSFAYNLGPNRSVDIGVVNVSLTDASQSQPYDRGMISTKYAHVQPQADGVTPLIPPGNPEYPASNSHANISTPIAQDGTWYNLGNPLLPQFEADNDLLLARGYYSFETARIQLARRDRVSIVNGQPVVQEEINHWDAKVVFSSMYGSHLHFEVRNAAKIGVPNEKHTRGEQNPHDWIGLLFGGWKWRE